MTPNGFRRSCICCASRQALRACAARAQLSAQRRAACCCGARWCSRLLAANNLLVILDLLLIRDQSISAGAGFCLSLGAVAVLLFGFIWDMEDA